MREMRSYYFDGAQLDDVNRTQEPAVITVGHSRTGRLFVLPYAAGLPLVESVYGAERIRGALRVNTSTNRDGMSEAVLLDILTEQVGPDGHVGGGAFAVVTRLSKDAGFAVPANAYWKAKVEASQ